MASPRFVLAVDQGTTSTRAVLLDAKLNVRGIGQQEFLSGTEASAGAGPIQLGQPGPGARPGTAPPGNVQPIQAPRPSTAPLLPPRSPATIPGSSPMPAMPQPSPPQFAPPPVNAPSPAAPAASGPPPALVPPSLIPSTPGT